MADADEDVAVPATTGKDVMNDAALDTRPATQDQIPSEGDTCRICRCEGTLEEPLFHPCKCSGSIKHVHQDCLMEWLSHSNKKHCELCKTPFRFTKLYNSQMPGTLPWPVFLRRAASHVMAYQLMWMRAVVVIAVWLLLLPWSIRWAWRGLFFMMDVGWAREAWVKRIESQPAHNAWTVVNASRSLVQAVSSTINHTLSVEPTNDTLPREPLAFSWSKFIWSIVAGPWQSPKPATAPSPYRPGSFASIAAQSTLLSDAKSVNALTSNPWLNRVILDIIEGQIITLVVVVAFILVFLIREWVVQQQPILHAAAHVREAEVQMHRLGQAERRLREVRERAALENLPEEDRPALAAAFEEEHAATEAASDTEHGSGIPSNDQSSDEDSSESTFADAQTQVDEPVRPQNANTTPPQSRFRGWDDLEEVINDASLGPLYAGQTEEDRINAAAERVLDQVKCAVIESGISVEEVVVKVGNIIERLPEECRTAWYSHLIEENKISKLIDQSQEYASNVASRGTRPNMPPRATSVSANSVLRALEEEAARQAEPESTGQGDVRSSGSSGSSEITDSWQDVHTPRISEPADDATQDLSNLDRIVQDDEQPRVVNDVPESEHDADHDQVNPNEPELPSLQTTTQDTEAVPELEPKGLLQQLLDWFWADVVPDPAAVEPVLALLDDDFAEDIADEGLFAHVHDMEDAPVVDDVAPGQDPEAFAAVAQAGLDADAVEEAEDLEGILELVGMQGPLLGLLQTAMFCGVLITVTLWGAVGAPYLFGKLALLFMGDPVLFLVVMPLQLLSGMTDFVLDVLTFMCGAVFYWSAQAVMKFGIVALQALRSTADLSFISGVANSALSACDAAASRLASMFTIDSNGELAESGYLLVSIQAHQSLKTLQQKIGQVLTVPASQFVSACKALPRFTFGDALPVLQAKLPQWHDQLTQTSSWVWQAISAMSKTGGLTLNVERPNPLTLDPSLAYWSATDRALSVLAGYTFLAFIGSVYLLRKEPLLGNSSIQRLEKTLADILRQAGGVLKVILIISIEMLAFPFYCGLLLDCALLPLFEGASFASRRDFASHSPWMFTFVHWFIGTCYMFHFALFVSMCRRMMRSGVLYFIRDPDDPTFHPVRDVLERNVTTQLRKIGFSALVYGALVILCLGGVVWGIDHSFTGVFPVRWALPEPILEFPVDFLLYNFVIPVVLRSVKPSHGLDAACEWWLRRAARQLRLSHFLFGERKQDEEGRHVRKSWSSFFQLRTADPEHPVIGEDRRLLADDRNIDVYFLRDGRYCRAPATDQVRIPKGNRVLVEVTEDDKRVDGQPDHYGGTHGRKDKNFTKVYVPPWFRVRIFLFLASLWLFSAATGLGTTVIPLVVGRKLFTMLLPSRVRVNDIYALCSGHLTLGGILYAALNVRAAYTYIRAKTTPVALGHALQKMWRGILQALKCFYVYGFAIVVVPSLFAITLQFYLVLPLRTYTSSMGMAAFNESTITLSAASASNITDSSAIFSNMTVTAAHALSDALSPATPLLAGHTIHLLQDWTLGFLYARVAVRLVLLSQTSRPASAFRTITSAGLLNPNTRLATRAFVLPTLLLFSVLLLSPLLVAAVANRFILGAVLPAGSFSTVIRTKIYRYSYPVCAAQGLVAWGGWELLKAGKRWRGRIRDEVYLVGERLHNFGETMPPSGSRSVVRKVR